VPAGSSGSLIGAQPNVQTGQPRPVLFALL
jgi:hypothetical protein